MEPPISASDASTVSRVLSLAYGLVAYVLFLGVFLYAIAFVGDFLVPRTIDSGGTTGAFLPGLERSRPAG